MGECMDAGRPYLYIHMYTFIISTIHECIPPYVCTVKLWQIFNLVV